MDNQIYDIISGGVITNQIASFGNSVREFSFQNVGSGNAVITWNNGTQTIIRANGNITSREFLFNAIQSFTVNAIGTTVDYIVTGISPYAISLSTPPTITLTFDNIANADLMVGDSSDVADWNTFFGLPANGTVFTSVTVAGNVVTLAGGSNITLKNSLFGGSAYGDSLLSIVDTGCIVTVNYDAFGDAVGAGCNGLVTIALPSVTDFGVSTANNGCFTGLTGNVIALTIPAALSSDGDIAYLQANNTVTLTTV